MYPRDDCILKRLNKRKSDKQNTPTCSEKGYEAGRAKERIGGDLIAFQLATSKGRWYRFFARGFRSDSAPTGKDYKEIAEFATYTHTYLNFNLNIKLFS